jgi:1-phosphatidylinositol phosphodiesterase
MSHVPDNTFLSQLSIPGTHESLALRQKSLGPINVDNPRCQTRSPYQQLQGGIRILDCRFDIFDQPDPDQDCLYAYHGDNRTLGAQQGYSCGAMLQSVRLFLMQNPNETVIVSIGDDPGANNESVDKRAERITRVFENDFRNFVSELFWQPGTRLTRETLDQYRLGDVRGRIILVHKNSFTKGWTANRSDFLKSSQDDNTHVLDNYSDHAIFLAKVSDHVSAAKKDANRDAVYRTDWNYGDLLDFGTSPFDTAESVQPTAEDIYTKVGKGRVGIVNFDFYEKFEKSVWAIIQSNIGIN